MARALTVVEFLAAEYAAKLGRIAHLVECDLRVQKQTFRPNIQRMPRAASAIRSPLDADDLR